MSIDEAAALKAVRDGLEGRNVPIVHEEIRVVLAMALERDALRARAETAERDLDIARGLIARLGDPDSLESLWALLRYERLRVAELERERDEARALNHRGLMKLVENERLRVALEEIAGMCSENAEQMQAIAQDALGSMPPSDLPYICPKSVAVAEDLTPGALNTTPETTPADAVLGDALLRHERARIADLERAQDAAFRDAHRAEADAARLREALTQVRDAMLATGQEPDGDDDPRRPVATAVWRALASAPSAETWRQVGQHAAHPELDATPSAEPTPRDMRVAEAVREACARIIATRNVENWTPEELAGEIRALDLAAVVAKAVKP